MRYTARAGATSGLLDVVAHTGSFREFAVAYAYLNAVTGTLACFRSVIATPQNCHKCVCVCVATLTLTASETALLPP